MSLDKGKAAVSLRNRMGHAYNDPAERCLWDPSFESY